MAHATRSSKRTVKLNRNEDFEYGEESIQILRDRDARGTNVWHQRTVQYSTCSDSSNPPLVNFETHPGNFVNNSSTVNILQSDVQQSVNSVNSIYRAVGDKRGRRSQGPAQYALTADDGHRINIPLSQCYDSAQSGGVTTRSSFRTLTSPRFDFLDRHSFLSVSPTAITDTSDMEGLEAASVEELRAQCQCAEGVSCTLCAASRSDSQDDLVTQLKTALGKIDFLTDKVVSIESNVTKQTVSIKQQNYVLRAQHDRLNKLESSGSESSARDSRGASSSQTSSKQQRRQQQQKQKNSSKEGSAKVNKKMVRIEEEKEKQYNVMTDKLRSREKRRGRESRVNIGSSFTSEESSDADFDMRDMRKKMKKKMRDDCNTKVSSRLKKAGAPGLMVCNSGCFL